MPSTPDGDTVLSANDFPIALCPVYAGWLAVEKQYQPIGIETIYLDPDQVQRKETHVTLWQFTNLKWNSAAHFLSLKTHKEFDCGQSCMRVLQVIEFSR
ncbi:MAG: surface-adhesin E family protein [Nitrospiraceae bacterium]